ncbi:AAA family ATPase [Nocardia acidivorans]|uniref:AAA family ATPase n=1 Tax=Nocardia acidivorans TaxID=404580 RepID=UPI000AFA4A75|nr:AAA family ATPase [Nocardia acidivorans]
MSDVTEVNRPITVAVMGTHSSGKSTFLGKLAAELRRRRIQVATVADLGEEAMRIGLPILSRHTWASTLWIITRGISNEIEAWSNADVVLIDRGVPDALGYYEAALEYRGVLPDPDKIAPLEQLVSAHSCHYDLMLRTVLNPQLPLGDNKPRDKDLTFRALADAHIEKVLGRLNVEHTLVTSETRDHAFYNALTFIDNRIKQPRTGRQ